MTPKQLKSLAIYRTHKHCQCGDCEEARRALSEYDRQPRVSGIGRRASARVLPAST